MSPKHSKELMDLDLYEILDLTIDSSESEVFSITLTCVSLLKLYFDFLIFSSFCKYIKILADLKSRLFSHTQ